MNNHSAIYHSRLWLSSLKWLFRWRLLYIINLLKRYSLPVYQLYWGLCFVWYSSLYLISQPHFT